MTMRARAEAVVAAVEAMGDDADKLFTAFDPQTLLSQAAEMDQATASDQSRPLHGVFVTIKDLFDQSGQITTAGSRLLADQPPAIRTAESVERLIDAGAVIVGRTTLSEFAYSGVGLNPHFGTPGSVFDKTRIPGGSTSGGALSVAHGLADIALGSDTGGSIRIPAAVNGLYGFKPSQTSISDVGVRPLAPSYDTVGPIARTLNLCERAFACLRSGAPSAADSLAAGKSETRSSTTADSTPLRLEQPLGAFTNDVDSQISGDFTHALDQIRTAGHTIEAIDLSGLAKLTFANRIIVSVEAHAIYEPYLDQLELLGDPRALARIRYRETLTDAEIRLAYEARLEAVHVYAQALAPFDALLAPTIAIDTPTIADTEANFDHINMMMLRNSSLINLSDGCAITLPFQSSIHRQGSAPAALMVAAPNSKDDELLGVARQLDQMPTSE